MHELFKLIKGPCPVEHHLIGIIETQFVKNHFVERHAVGKRQGMRADIAVHDVQLAVDVAAVLDILCPPRFVQMDIGNIMPIHQRTLLRIGECRSGMRKDDVIRVVARQNGKYQQNRKQKGC